MSDETRATVETDPSAVGGPGAPRWMSSTALFRGERKLIIVHRSHQYRLRITKGDKLILAK